MSTAYRPAVMTDCVIDLSHNNAIANPVAAFKTAAAGGILAVIHKATQGSGYIDPTLGVVVE